MMILNKKDENNARFGAEIDLLEIIYAIADRIRLVVSAAFIGAFIMAFYSFLIAAPIYNATSKLYVLNRQDSAINLSDLQIGAYLTSDYQEVFDTWEVQQMVLENLQLDYTRSELRGMIDVRNPANTRMLYITAESSKPMEAMAIANEFASVAQKYISDTMETDEPSMMSQALLPQSPVRPRRFMNVCIGFVGGGFIAMFIIAIKYMVDDRIRTVEDIQRYSGLETFAVVPKNDRLSSGINGDADDKMLKPVRKRGKV